MPTALGGYSEGETEEMGSGGLQSWPLRALAWEYQYLRVGQGMFHVERREILFGGSGDGGMDGARGPRGSLRNESVEKNAGTLAYVVTALRVPLYAEDEVR